MSAPRHLLLDADGVLQRHPGGLTDVLRRVLGGGTDEALVSVFADEAPYLTSGGDFPEAFGRRLRELGVRAAALEAHRRVWLTIETDPAVLALVAEVRRGGLPVHLATNQHVHRAAHMRDVLGYGAHFDTCFYSCDLRLAKPDPAYFTAIAARLGVAVEECLLVDDNRSNVRAARRLGLPVVQWTTRDGLPSLRAQLAEHGVPLGS